MNRASLTPTGRSCWLLLLVVLAVSISSCVGNNAVQQTSADSLGKQALSDVRILSWNVKTNSILPPDGLRRDSFARIVRAMDPDVIALQEVMRPNLAVILSQLMNRIIPLDDGRSWSVHTVSDNVLISRHPMRWTGGSLTVPHPRLENFTYGFAAALVDLPESAGVTDLLLIATHNKSGANDDDVRLRQRHADAIVRWVRDGRGSAQENSIADRTPIVVLGDINVVPEVSMAPFETLLRGDIFDEPTFGPDSSIDWDGTDMADAKPSHNGWGREYYTWRNDDLPFAPSALDRILYTDSVMSVRRRFVLNTTTLSPTELANLRLEKSDVLFDGNPREYDHLPLVVDFELDEVFSE